MQLYPLFRYKDVPIEVCYKPTHTTSSSQIYECIPKGDSFSVRQTVYMSNPNCKEGEGPIEVFALNFFRAKEVGNIFIGRRNGNRLFFSLSFI